jgi:hypothetical protein
MMIPETRRTQYIVYLRFYYYHWFPEGIIRPVISDSAMTWFLIIFITEIYFRNNVIINKTKVLHPQA